MCVSVLALRLLAEQMLFNTRSSMCSQKLYMELHYKCLQIINTTLNLPLLCFNSNHISFMSYTVVIKLEAPKSSNLSTIADSLCIFLIKQYLFQTYSVFQDGIK